jgi:uncharacterized protein with PIN domain
MIASPSPEFHPSDWRCPNCDGSLRLLQTLLNSVQGKTVHIFECRNCRRLVWDD